MATDPDARLREIAKAIVDAQITATRRLDDPTSIQALEKRRLAALEILRAHVIPREEVERDYVRKEDWLSMVGAYLRGWRDGRKNIDPRPQERIPGCGGDYVRRPSEEEIEATVGVRSFITDKPWEAGITIYAVMVFGRDVSEHPGDMAAAERESASWRFFIGQSLKRLLGMAEGKEGDDDA